MSKKSSTQAQQVGSSAADTEQLSDWTTASKGQATDGNAATVDTGVTAVKKVETKQQKFKRLLGERLPKTMKRLEQILSLTNRAQYEWSQAQAEYAIGNLFAMVDRISNSFQGVKESQKTWQIPD